MIERFAQAPASLFGFEIKLEFLQNVPQPTRMAELHEDLFALDVNCDVELGATFSLELLLSDPATHEASDADTEYKKWLDFFYQRLGEKLKIEVVFAGRAAADRLIIGVITRISAHVADDPDDSRVRVEGVDRSVELDRAEKHVAWTRQALANAGGDAQAHSDDLAIAKAILKHVNLPPPTEEIARPDDSTVVVQRETDLQFLRRLARRNGRVFRNTHADGGSEPWYFGPPLDPNARALSEIQVRPRDPSPINELFVEFDDTARREAKLFAMSDSTRHPNAGWLRTRPALPGPAPADLLLSASEQPNRMESLVKTTSAAGKRRIRYRGALDASSYKDVLQVGRKVRISGIAQALDGDDFVVERVRHSIAEAGYTQHFHAYREVP